MARITFRFPQVHIPRSFAPDTGGHTINDPSKGLCVVEALFYTLFPDKKSVASTRVPCTNSYLRATFMNLNDSPDEKWRHILLKHVHRILGTSILTDHEIHECSRSSRWREKHTEETLVAFLDAIDLVIEKKDPRLAALRSEVLPLKKPPIKRSFVVRKDTIKSLTKADIRSLQEVLA